MSLSIKAIRKFQFRNHELAHKVRGTMRAALVRFDENNDQKF